MEFINKISLRKNCVYTSRQLRKNFKFPKLKKKKIQVNQEISRNGALEASMISISQYWPAGPCSVIVNYQSHHFSSTFEDSRGDWHEFIVKRANKTIFRLSSYWYRCCKSLKSQIEYKELDIFGICRIIHLNIGISL